MNYDYFDSYKDGIYENYTIQQKNMIRVHKSASDVDERGFNTQEEADAEASKYLLDNETLEDMKENVVEQTEEEVLNRIEDDIKSVAEQSEDKKINILFYYAKKTENENSLEFLNNLTQDEFDGSADKDVSYDGTDENTTINPFLIDINN